MASKRSLGNFNKLQRQIDQLKFEVDEFCEDDLPNVGTASPGRLSAYKRAKNLENEARKLKQNLNALDISTEKMPTARFNEKKAIEMNRLNRLKDQLSEVINQLEPDEVEEEYFRKFEKQEKNAARKSILKSPENILDESGITKSVKIKSASPSPRKQIDEEGVDDYGDDDDELDSEELDNDEEEFDEEDEEIYEQGNGDEVICVVEGLADYEAEEDGDLPFKKNDRIEIVETSEDGWWTGRDKYGNEGLIPNTLVKVIKEDVESQHQDKEKPQLEKKRSGKELWDHLKEAKPSKTSVTDVLKAMKAIPSGFRSSTLGKWYQKEKYRTSSFIIPKTDGSNLQFKDLFWDGVNKKLRPQNITTCRTFSLVSVKCIPPIGVGVEILSRHVYVALWDEEKILSNIHLIRAVPLERDMSWTFTPKVAKNIPSLYDGDIVARINSDDRKISLLIELNYSYQRVSTGERSDICCGWVSLPLFDANGAPIGNKNHDLHVNGGTPFEKGVQLDPTLNLNASQSLMQSLIRSNRQPRVTIKTTSYNRLAKEIYDMLPQTLVTCPRYSRFIGYYRQHAASVYCKDDIIEKGTVFDALLTQFPKALDYHDLMDALNMIWEEKNRTQLNRSLRKNNAHMQMMFTQAFNESVLSLMQSTHLPPFLWADENAEKARLAFILSFIQTKNDVGNLLSSDHVFKPLNITKMTFTNNSPHALFPQPITSEIMSPS